MTRTTFRAAAVLAGLVVLGGVTTSAVAGGDDKSVSTRLKGFEEVPAVLTDGGGSFRARIDRDDEEIRYTLRYGDLNGAVQQAHIHFGQRKVNGGVVVFLCSNLTGAPAGTQACPAADGTVTGTIVPANVIGVQGIETGSFDDLVEVIRAGKTYVNVHTVPHPGGEVRGQLDKGHHHHD